MLYMRKFSRDLYFAVGQSERFSCHIQFKPKLHLKFCDWQAYREILNPTNISAYTCLR